MPVEPDDSVLKEVYYPDDVTEVDGFQIRERFAFWDSDDSDDSEELPEEARHGLWLPVTPLGHGEEESWLSAPRQLREALVEAEVEAGDSFRVLEMEKGPADHDPYEVEIEAPYEM
jgi:hypothetical protein